jgi:hypothetical protein
MKARNMLAIAILILASVAAFYCYTRLAQLLPMSDAARVEKTQATITEVHTPMVKKGQSVTDVVSDVRFAFTVDGKTITGGYTVQGRDAAPAKGTTLEIAYRVDRPAVFLRGDDYADLPHQLAALRWMMWGFALIAMVMPFAVMKHGA